MICLPDSPTTTTLRTCKAVNRAGHVVTVHLWQQGKFYGAGYDHPATLATERHIAINAFHRYIDLWENS